MAGWIDKRPKGWKERIRYGAIDMSDNYARSTRRWPPVDVDAKKVEASLDEGVLTIRIPKAAAEQPKHINIS